MVKPGSNTVGLLKSYKHEKKTAYKVRLIKQVASRELGLYTNVAAAQRTELNIK